MCVSVCASWYPSCSGLFHLSPGIYTPLIPLSVFPQGSNAPLISVTVWPLILFFLLLPLSSLLSLLLVLCAPRVALLIYVFLFFSVLGYVSLWNLTTRKWKPLFRIWRSFTETNPSASSRAITSRYACFSFVSLLLDYGHAITDSPNIFGPRVPFYDGDTPENQLNWKARLNSLELYSWDTLGGIQNYNILIIRLFHQSFLPPPN